MHNPIERHRQQKGWTRRELSRHTGVSVGTVVAWERGVMPRAKNLWRLAILFNVDIIELINQILDWRADQRPTLTLETATGPACSQREGRL
jgi:transcriptional regulator with XRE-family HTH domain